MGKVVDMGEYDKIKGYWTKKKEGSGMLQTEAQKNQLEMAKAIQSGQIDGAQFLPGGLALFGQLR